MIKLIIFGITGDLAQRKLLPALESIVNETPDLSIIGVSRRDVSVDEVLGERASLKTVSSMFTMDLSDKTAYGSLLEHLGEPKPGDRRLYYLAVPPGAATDIADLLGEAGLNAPQDTILFEKPFGYDYESAKEYIARTAKYYREDQILRIDHYMAKEIAYEIIRLRRDAENHHYHWGTGVVERVEIVAHETLGVERRAAFYEQIGATRDVIQGHLMQLLSLVLMRPPQDFSKLPGARLSALEKLNPVRLEDVATAQYDGYREEVASPHSKVETYARMTLYSSDPNWHGVPLKLETGKKMPEKKTFIKVVYRDGREDVFDESAVVFETNTRLKDAYEHVLMAAINGDRAIFTTSEEVLASWRVLETAIHVA